MWAGLFPGGVLQVRCGLGAGGPSLRVSQPAGLFSHVDASCCVVVGCGLAVCIFFQFSGEGSGVLGVPFRYPVGCGVGCVNFGVCVSSPHRFAWVRGLQCSGMML
jgi:hypothetical protein